MNIIVGSMRRVEPTIQSPMLETYARSHLSNMKKKNTTNNFTPPIQGLQQWWSSMYFGVLFHWHK